MSNIDGRVSGLNAQVYTALKSINVSDGINKAEAQKLKEAIDADGQIDAGESDLIDELLSNQNNISVEAASDAGFGPMEVAFSNLPAGKARIDADANNTLADIKVRSLTSGPAPTEDQLAKDTKKWQHLFHELHLGSEVATKLHHVLKHSPNLARVLNFMPKAAQLKVLEMMGEVASKYGGKALEGLHHALESKLMKGISIAADAYGAGYYGSLATGMNYPNVNVNGTEYEVRPSAGTKTLAGITAAFYGGSIAATATGAGAVAAIGLSVGSLVAGAITDWSLGRDKEIMTNVVNRVMNAPDGESLRHGLDALRAEYGSLSEVQQVLGQAPIDQQTGNVVSKANEASTNHVDRDMVGTVANRILDAGVKGEISPEEARRAISDLMKGVSERWTSDDDVAQSFINQVFLKFGGDKETFTKALGMLGSDVRLAMFKMLDGGITWGETGSKTLDWLLNEHENDLSEARVMEFLADVEPDTKTRGKMIAQLMDGATRGRMEDMAFNLIDKTYQESVRSGDFSKFNKLLKEIKLDGEDASRLSDVADELSPARAGKVLAWMVESGAPKAQIDNFIERMSSHLTDDDDITMAFLGEIDKMRIDPSRLAGSMSQSSISKMMRSLESGWTANSEYTQIEKLAKLADGPGKADIINRLMNGATFSRAESAISRIMNQTTPQQLPEVLSRVNTRDLGNEMEDSGEYGSVMRKIQSANDDPKLAAYIAGGDEDSVIAAYAGMSPAEKSRLGDHSRNALFQHFVNSGRFTDAKAMMESAKSPQTKRDMAAYLAKNVTNFSNPTEAGKAAAWVMAHGNQTDIDTAFNNIKGKWFGKGGEIVKAALDQAKADKLDIKGKLSLNTLTSMMGSLNTAWTKMFGNYSENLSYVRELANVVNVEGKAAIVKDLMDYWTPGEAETLIHDVFKDTTNRADFTRLVDSVGPARISSELENRQELGRVMAFVVQRYDGNRDNVLNQIMNKWSSTSIQSDDILQAMVEQLGGGRILNDSRFNAGTAQQALRGLSNSTLETMVDWSDDAFRDGNAFSLDPETARLVQVLNASKR